MRTDPAPVKGKALRRDFFEEDLSRLLEDPRVRDVSRDVARERLLRELPPTWRGLMKQTQLLCRFIDGDHEVCTDLGPADATPTPENSCDPKVQVRDLSRKGYRRQQQYDGLENTFGGGDLEGINSFRSRFKARTSHSLRATTSRYGAFNIARDHEIYIGYASANTPVAIWSVEIQLAVRVTRSNTPRDRFPCLSVILSDSASVATPDTKLATAADKALIELLRCVTKNAMTCTDESIDLWLEDDPTWYNVSIPLDVRIELPQSKAYLASRVQSSLVAIGTPRTYSEITSLDRAELALVETVVVSDEERRRQADAATLAASSRAPNRILAPGEEFLLLQFEVDTLKLTSGGRFLSARLLDSRATYIHEYHQTPEETLELLGLDVESLQKLSDNDEVEREIEAVTESGYNLDEYGEDLDFDRARRALHLAGMPRPVRGKTLLLRLLVDACTNVTFARLANASNREIAIDSFLRDATQGHERDTLGHIPLRLKVGRALAQSPAVERWCARNGVCLTHPRDVSDNGAKHVKAWRRDLGYAAENFYEGWWSREEGASASEIERSVRYLSRVMTGTTRDVRARGADELDRHPPDKYFVMGQAVDTESWAAFKAGHSRNVRPHPPA
jgi:hypothetical protein